MTFSAHCAKSQRKKVAYELQDAKCIFCGMGQEFPMKCLQGYWTHLSCLFIINHMAQDPRDTLISEFTSSSITLNKPAVVRLKNTADNSRSQCCICLRSGGMLTQCLNDENSLPCSREFHPICGYLVCSADLGWRAGRHIAFRHES